MIVLPSKAHEIQVNGHTLQVPIVWLGQSVDTSVLSARVPEMHAWPVLTSLGDAMRRIRYLKSHFNEHLRLKLGLSGPLMIDSGGFVLMTKKVTGWSASTVAKVYRQVDADILVSLDLPPSSTDTPAQRRKKRQSTISNLRWLSSEFEPERLMPVIHGATIGEIQDSCAAVQKISPRPHWIGLGGLVPMLRQFGRREMGSSRARYDHFSTSLATVRRAFPYSLVHVFGAGAPRSCLAAFALGAHSADSQAWRQAAGFGSIYVPGKGQRILEWTRPHKRPRPIVDVDDRRLLAACTCPACRRYRTRDLRIRQLKDGFEARSIHNAWVLREEVNALRDAARVGNLKSFLEGRLPKTWLEIVLQNWSEKPTEVVTSAAVESRNASSPVAL